MKKLKKILSVVFVLVMVFSMCSLPVHASTDIQAASSVNFKVISPSVGKTPRDCYVTSSTSYYPVYSYHWLEAAPDDTKYHEMSSYDEFKSGYYYRVVILYDIYFYSPDDVPDFHPTVTVNGDKPTYVEDNFVYYDFPKLGGLNGGSVLGTILGIVTFPIKLIFEIILLPFQLFFY